MAKYDVGSMYYINQGAEPFANIKMGKSTVKSIGCVVCAFAMLICHKEGYTAEEDAIKVVQDIIDECVDSKGYINTTFSNKNNILQKKYQIWHNKFMMVYQ